MYLVLCFDFGLLFFKIVYGGNIIREKLERWYSIVVKYMVYKVRMFGRF